MQVERIDDIPLICNELKTLEIGNLINSHFPVHGNWQGASIGTLSCVFLSYIMSQSDHRLSHVEDWYSSLETIINHCLESPTLTRLDCTDDRLGSLLDYLSDDACYEGFERALNQHIIRVYSLESEAPVIHLDATIAQSYKSVSDLFSIGYAKHRHKDLPQVKVMLSTLDPLGMALCVQVVNGAVSDDVLYLPMVERVEKTLEKKGLLFVGDSKLGSIGNRGTIAHKGHYYLTPLNGVQLPFSELQKLVTPEALKRVIDKDKLIYLGQNKEIRAFEYSLMRQYEGHTWQERLIVAHSPSYSETQITQLDKQIKQAEQKIKGLIQIKQGKTAIQNEVELRQKIKDILDKSKTSAFFTIHIDTTITQTITRKYGNRPQQSHLKSTFALSIHPDLSAIEAHKQTLGWRVYATNAPVIALDTAKVIETYKEEYKVEYCFDQLHNKIAQLMPIYLHKDQRIKALIRLLLIACKVLSTIQFKAREALKNTQSQVNELFPGNPGRKTNQPTAEMMLSNFLNISLVFMLINNTIHIQVSRLSKSQIYLLKLLDIDPRIYQDLPQVLLPKFKWGET